MRKLWRARKHNVMSKWYSLGTIFSLCNLRMTNQIKSNDRCTSSIRCLRVGLPHSARTCSLGTRRHLDNLSMCLSVRDRSRHSSDCPQTDATFHFTTVTELWARIKVPTSFVVNVSLICRCQAHHHSGCGHIIVSEHVYLTMSDQTYLIVSNCTYPHVSEQRAWPYLIMWVQRWFSRSIVYSASYMTVNLHCMSRRDTADRERSEHQAMYIVSTL